MFIIEERTADFIASISLDECEWSHRTIATYETQEQADEAFSEYLAHPYRVGDTRYAYALLSDNVVVSYIDIYEAEHEMKDFLRAIDGMPPKKIILKKVIPRHESVFRTIEKLTCHDEIAGILAVNGLSHLNVKHVCRYLKQHSVDELMARHRQQQEKYHQKRAEKRARNARKK